MLNSAAPIAFAALNLTMLGDRDERVPRVPDMTHARRNHCAYICPKPRRTSGILCVLIALFAHLLCETESFAGEKWVLRVGHFSNITHAQALIGRAMAREGKPWFEPRLGKDVALDWYVYPSGSGAMEAILARTLDLTYVGAAPTLNAHARMSGKDIRIVSGSCSGGAALLVQPHLNLRADSDFKGKTLGTPQLGNTQDLAARTWLRSVGHRVTLTGGDVMVIPSANPDLYALFRKKDIDAIWTVEPWVSRLMSEAGATIYFEESARWPETHGRYATTLLVSSVRLLTEHRTVLERFVAAHASLTEWIQTHSEEAQALVNRELASETKHALPREILNSSWKRLEFTTDPIAPSIAKQANQMRELGFNRRPTDFSKLYELGPLNALLTQGTRLPTAP